MTKILFATIFKLQNYYFCINDFL